MFTPCGNTGQSGPSQSNCDGAYAGTTLDGEVTVSAGIQQWVVPETGTYVVEAAGARGGVWNNGSIRMVGAGARMVGEFSLTQGEVIQVLVGQPAADNPNGNTGGGGGSFVTRAPHNTNASILVIVVVAAMNVPRQEFSQHPRHHLKHRAVWNSRAGLVRWVQWQWCHRWQIRTIPVAAVVVSSPMAARAPILVDPLAMAVKVARPMSTVVLAVEHCITVQLVALAVVLAPMAGAAALAAVVAVTLAVPAVTTTVKALLVVVVRTTTAATRSTPLGTILQQVRSSSTSFDVSAAAR